MQTVAITDASLGQGPLMVGTPMAVFSLNLPFDRTTWKTLANPIQTVAPISGPLAPMAMVNGDLWYRSLDGIRSYVMALRNFNTWGNTPNSREVSDALDRDDQALLGNASTILWNNWLLTTCSPFRDPNLGICHRGLVALDLSPVSLIGYKSPPVWCGTWTGLRILALVKGLVNGTERCFAYVPSDDSKIQLWELVDGQDYDWGPNGQQPITWRARGAAFKFQTPYSLKQLSAGQLYFESMLGPFSLSVSYKSDEAACWTPWYRKPGASPTRNARHPRVTCWLPPVFREQYRGPINLPQPDDAFDLGNSQRKNRSGHQFEIEIQVTGAATLKQLRLGATMPIAEMSAFERNPK